MIDAIELLKDQHRDALNMIARLREEDVREGERLELFDHLKEALSLHTKMEEEVLYPALEHFKETRELVAESYQEHHQVDRLLQKIAELGSSGGRHGNYKDNKRDDDWRSLLDELTADITHHVEEEENELFPKAQRLLTPDRIKEMGYEMRGIRTGQSKTDQLIYPASRFGPV